MCDRLITNFHQPQSTLMLLVAAFANKDFIMRAYEEAIKKNIIFILMAMQCSSFSHMNIRVGKWL